MIVSRLVVQGPFDTEQTAFNLQIQITVTTSCVLGIVQETGSQTISETLTPYHC